MAQEIERKFLVDKEKWAATQKPLGRLYRQGYLLTDLNKTIRVRLTDTEGYLTIKGKNDGQTRAEYEYSIPAADAKELLDAFASSELSKIRYELLFDNKIWEVDEFLGENEGLIVAEIELLSEDEKFTLPAWIGREVTGEIKYYNSNLTLVPFKNW
ncbi:CYTH domain-containing protein [soil metagenome]